MKHAGFPCRGRTLAKLQMEDAMQRVIEKRHAMDDAMHSRTQQ